jgi:hypothetical protein
MTVGIFAPGLIVVAGSMLMELLRAIRPLELMAFTRDTHQKNGQDQQREQFHCGAS